MRIMALYKCSCFASSVLSSQGPYGIRVARFSRIFSKVSGVA